MIDSSVMAVFRSIFFTILLSWTALAKAHPLKLSLCEIEYSSKKQLLSISLKLFLTDINEALVFNPNSEELAFCQPDEPVKTNQLLLNYLNQFFFWRIFGSGILKASKEKQYH